MKYSHSDPLTRNAHHFFRSKRLRDSSAIFLIVALAIGAMVLLRFDIVKAIVNIPKAANRFVQLYLPPAYLEIDKLLDAVWLTILLATTAGTLGSLLAYLAALGMSKQTGKILPLQIALRTIATFIRNVPVTIWAIILLMAFWYGEFLALLVMTMATFGFNARLYSDLIDETNTSSIEALRASGASYWQIVTQAIIPETMPGMISWTLYAIELNIRSATIIGMLAGGGIGHLIGIYKHFRRFDELLGAVLVIVVLILAFDQMSMYIRKQIL